MGKRLEDKVALVSAATNGIGLACALRMAEEGARVFLGARNEEKAQKIIQAHADLDLHFVYFDAADEKTFRQFVTDVAEKAGRLDILVNNYGHTEVEKDLDVEHTSFEDFFAILRTNLASVYLACQSALPIMQKQGEGSIINISSVGGIFPDLQRTAYGMSKNGINFLTQIVATQAAKDGVRCNAVMPSFTKTDATKNNMSEEFLNAFLTAVPLKRAGEVTDLANAVLFLASEESSYITGQLIPVSGGFGVPTPLYSLYQMKTRSR